jgi:hypothetical protein
MRLRVPKVDYALPGDRHFEPTPANGQEFVLDTTAQVAMMPPEHIAKSPGALWSVVANDLGFDKSDRETAATKFLSKEFWSVELDIVIDSRTEAKQTSFGTDSKTPQFAPGLVQGRAYFYDYRAQKITCAGSFEASNAETVSRAGMITSDNALKYDLSNETIRAAIMSLRERAEPAKEHLAESDAGAATTDAGKTVSGQTHPTTSATARR